LTAEFELISRYFTKTPLSARLGVGDDCALLDPEKTIAASMDMLVEGTHFFPNADPFLLGKKTLSVNLSDLAAMGAKPRWAMLAISMPCADEVWLEAFSKGFFEVARRHSVDLVGGDTTRGPLAFCVQVMGEINAELALRRDMARAEEDIWVSGTLGDAALGLAHAVGEIRLEDQDAAFCLNALHDPVPRVELGLALCGISKCAIDISDGLCADLLHILERSKVSAEIDYLAIPVSNVMEKYRMESIGEAAILSGGDDYELCFTASPDKRSEIEDIGKTLGVRLSRVGRTGAGKGLVVLGDKGRRMNLGKAGYEHFG
jgi:thiamine-monophosphate kinase